MKSHFWFILLGSLLFLSGCLKDELGLPDQPLQGSLAGQPWEYNKANGFLQTTDFKYLARFISKNEPVDDPCSLPRPGLAHVKAIFTPNVGSFTVSAQSLSDDQVQVAFELDPSTTIIAVSGFMEIYDIRNSVAFGYLQAILDEENTVEGTFQISFCDR